MKQLAVPSFTVFRKPRHDCAVRAARAPDNCSRQRPGRRRQSDNTDRHRSTEPLRFKPASFARSASLNCRPAAPVPALRIDARTGMRIVPEIKPNRDFAAIARATFERPRPVRRPPGSPAASYRQSTPAIIAESPVFQSATRLRLPPCGVWNPVIDDSELLEGGQNRAATSAIAPKGLG